MTFRAASSSTSLLGGTGKAARTAGGGDHQHGQRPLCAEMGPTKAPGRQREGDHEGHQDHLREQDLPVGRAGELAEAPQFLDCLDRSESHRHGEGAQGGRGEADEQVSPRVSPPAARGAEGPQGEDPASPESGREQVAGADGDPPPGRGDSRPVAGSPQGC